MSSRCCVDCTAVGDGGEGQAAEACRVSYLEPLGKSVDERKRKEEEAKGEEGRRDAVEGIGAGRLSGIVKIRSAGMEVRPCRCKLWFCPDCCFGNGLNLRRRLIPVLETFSSVMMLTLTVDPKLFGSPAEAFDYVRRNRLVARLVKGLFLRGELDSRRFFCVIEWQKNGMPHWHLLVESARVEFRVLKEVWDANRPTSAGPVEGDAPGFGSVRFSKEDFADCRHAALYATKYLIKHPRHGYPDWVLDSQTQIKRYSTSRGFWGGTANTDGDDRDRAAEEAAARASQHALRDALAEAADAGIVSAGLPPVETEIAPVPKRSTIRERLARCGQQAVIVEALEGVCADGSVVRLRPWVIGWLKCSFRVALAMLGVPDDGRRSAPATMVTIKQTFAQLFLELEAVDCEEDESGGAY